MTPSFNLLTEPWILAQDPSGEQQEYGILELLQRSPELTQIVDPAPPVQFGIYRLLVAFLMDALDMRELEDLSDLLRGGRFDIPALNRYVEQVGTDRFDLFHPRYPWLQSGPMPDDADRVTSAARLFFHLPTGTNIVHFNHMPETAHAIAPAVCARALCAVAPFMTAGGAGYSPSINGTPPWYVLIRRNNLFQTLLFNCFVMDSLGLNGKGGVPWRTDRPVTPKQEVGCRSLVEGLTWRPRQVRLIPGAGGRCTYTGQHAAVLVREVVYGPGFKFAGDVQWTDPNAAYRTTDQGRFPLRPQEERELWRDTGPLLLLRDKDYAGDKGKVSFSRPLVVEQFDRLKVERKIPKDSRIEVEVYGMRADKAKVFEWQHERLRLPLGVDAIPKAGPQVQTAIEFADSVAYAMRKAMKELYPRQGKSNEKALDTAIEAAQRRYWAELHGHFQMEFLPGLAAQDVTDPAAGVLLKQRWTETLRRTGFQALNVAIEPFDSGACALARQVAARELFARLLAKLLDPAPEGTIPAKGRRNRGA